MKAIAGLLCLLGLAALPGGEAVDKLKLSSGHEIPVVGLGTSSTRNLEEVDKAITNALKNGYRHIDTAFAYHNEEAIGKTLKKWFDQGGKREDLFITSKLPSQGNRPESVEKYLKRSLKDLGLDYVDMYLVHTPFAEAEKKNTYEAEEKGGYNILEVADHVGVWKEMEKQVKAGRAKSIGLSNFNQTQILNVYNNAEIKPSNLQVESHAYLHQKDLRKFCKDHNIVMTAYAPLGSQKNREQLHKGTKKALPALFEVPLVQELAKKYKKTPGQIILRHTVQDGLVVIPKSSDAKRQKDNISLFDFQLTNEEMQKMDQLDKGELGRVFDFLAFYKDLDKHPQYPWALV